MTEPKKDPALKKAPLEVEKEEILDLEDLERVTGGLMLQRSNGCLTSPNCGTGTTDICGDG
jgi:hypothetical protein